MKVKYSNNGEILLIGSRSELNKLHIKLIEMLNSENKEFYIKLDSNYDPAPYEYIAERIAFSISIVNTIEIKSNTLAVRGAEGFIESFARNLPFDVDNTPYHVHYDYISFSQFLTEDSPEVVIEATS